MIQVRRNAALATASAPIGSDLPRPGPARRCGAISFGGTRTNDSPPREQLALQPPCQLPAVLNSPQPLSRKRRRPGEQPAATDPTQLGDRAPNLLDGNRPQSRRKPRSDQVTLAGLAKAAAATQPWQLNPRGDMQE